jgi:serine phosphatase RsbU (regulator of sigma subunit)/anti-sigma regulatory factor (Ser/Thr protein kinase)
MTSKVTIHPPAEPDDNPFRRPGLAARLWPFALVAVLAEASLALPHASGDWPAVTVSLALLAVTALEFAAPWPRLPAWTHVLVPVTYAGSVLALGIAGGTVSGIGIVVLIPLIWTALFHRPWESAVVVAAIVVVEAATSVVQSATDAVTARRILLFGGVGALLAVATHGLRDRIARSQQEALRLQGESEQQRHVALTLQHALMGPIRDVPDMACVSRYFPATQGAGVGGDWLDLIPLGARRTGVLIGDVMGRGLEAATVMGQLRSAASALARTGMPPRQLMHALDMFARDIPDQLTTCCYLVIDPNAGEVTGCSAGHLPVLLVDPDRSVRRLPIPVSVPLGVGRIPHEQVTEPVAASATLVLYTDGLVETHRCDIDERIAVLEAQLGAVFASGPTLDQAADQILATLPPDAGEPPDDVTLLLATIPPAPLASSAIDLRPEPQAATAARRFVSKTLAGWGYPDHAATACLLASEILTNAVRHARADIGLRMYHTAGEIIIEITDDSTHLPRRRLTGPGEENGRGLMLVEALATDWGARPDETGKTVWFRLAV